MLYLIARFYHFRAELIMSSQPLPEQHVLGTPPKLVMTQEKTLRHLKQIQCSLAQVCDLYDAFYNLYKVLDWSTPAYTIMALQVIVASMAGTWLVLYFVPWNYIVLVCGLGVFLANTAVFRAASATLTPALLENVQTRINQAREALSLSRMVGEQGRIAVELFENQRWWAGAGFIPNLLSQERQPWSDHSGLIQQPPKDLFDPPESDVFGKEWEWLDEDWTLDYSWTLVDTAGWQYSDNSWEKPKPKSSLGCYTRRRKWVRVMKLINSPTSTPESTPAISPEPSVCNSASENVI